MRNTPLACIVPLLASVAAPALAQAPAQSPAALDDVWGEVADPSPEARPMMRWWWFGPAVTHDEIDREIRAMKAGGIGGFEVQPVYPLAPDGAEPGLVNLPYLSDGFIAALRHAGTTARAEGMRIDVTGGSGWPFGGPHIPVSQAAASVRLERIPVPAGASDIKLPAAGPGEKLLAAMIGPARAAVSEDRPLAAVPIDGPRVAVQPADTPREMLVFVAGRTGQQVKRPAIGAEGFVLDHIDPAAIANHIATVGDRLLEAFAGETPPYAVFSDSLEAYGSSWTGDLPAEFKRRRGYDLLAHLPALFLDTPKSAAVRYDWALTLSELVDERYLIPTDAWAKKRGTRFRSQTYGFPPPTLSSNGLVALPEGEGANWRSFTSTRWASSGAHLYDKPVVSSEVWTWLHSPSWAATPLDMKMEADRHFLQGVTQLIGHGWPYTPSGMPEPGWAFYAAAALNDHNPWWGVMPDVSRYMQRVSHALRLGEPANGVAIYLPTEDAFADMRPERASVNEQMHERVSDALIAQVLDAGHGFDFVDARAIRERGIRHRLMVLPPMERIDPQAYAAIAKWVAGGGRVVAVHGWPSTAGGLLDGAKGSAAVAKVSQALARAKGAALVEQAGLGAAITATVPGDMRLAAPNPEIGFIRRKLPQGDLYFVANTSNRTMRTSARFAGDKGNGSWWDPQTGRKWAAGTGDIALDLAPYESRLLLFSGTPALPASTSITAGSVRALDDWTLEIAGKAPQPLKAFASWNADPTLRYFSGTASYRRTIEMQNLSGKCVGLDFGGTAPLPRPPGRPSSALQVPVRDAAMVLVNGERVGSLWAPPYRIDITRWLRTGANNIEVQVSNTAVNLLAGRAPTDYRLLTARYTERFRMQDIEKYVSQPSGLLGEVTLVESEAGAAPCGTGQP
ncbi:glycosyl hydrolase [Sphingomonas sp.]|jgi:hypothetical protein|uniref:glycosyl hydrolase n=1 Tax=Sphingomonas sp. TaxID=28214 RepID=UPI002ED89D02